MSLFFRYYAFFALSLMLPVFVLLPWGDETSPLNLLLRLMLLPSYCCAVIVILIGLVPGRLGEVIRTASTLSEDPESWLAPIFTITAFLWAGLHLVGILVLKEFNDNYPLVYLCLGLSALALGGWIASIAYRSVGTTSLADL
ncbi:hypothetical protein [Neptunicoccus sediminis]|uniref:hypothetical protein n=1 Tax=Neptunicoccus sediminis TaxID=1892596 RepID=UPI000845FF95|nr:hypothetical protein [Neptunicoccus sediminis]